uniref:Secreted protein n=1 Tax=Picea glauca TaxID=3330 RepID=A0A101M1V3_PICGL|nr:hypothetical protein ABT39_MTgene2744 [Picea glauca]QHR92142.1 hypothetical protein Q903MT_gene6179 [Picea sitchensis]
MAMASIITCVSICLTGLSRGSSANYVSYPLRCIYMAMAPPSMAYRDGLSSYSLQLAGISRT